MAPSTQVLAASSQADVDYVIAYKFADLSKTEAAKEFEQLVQEVSRVGLETEVRNGGKGSLLLFVRLKDEKRFTNAVYRSRIRDWLHGVRATQPDREAHQALEGDPVTEAERYRIIHHLLTAPTAEGGASITPKTGKWKRVESLFPLHNPEHNKAWIKKWSTRTFLKIEDLDEIRDTLGEKIAYYFAFTQSYFAFLLFPAAVGLLATSLLGTFSPIYAVASILWCVTFVEWWKHQELDLAVRWGVRGISAVQEKRKDFQYEKKIKDPITGEEIEFFPAKKRIARQALQIPFALLAALLLGTIIATCFSIEIFISELYHGPGKSVLAFLPTILLTTCVPTLSSILTTLATKLNDYENHETTESYQSALTAKLFVINFITSYMGVMLTAFVYLPFGNIIVPYLDIFHVATDRLTSEKTSMKTSSPRTFQINPDRLRKQVIYITVTAQIVNFLTEVVVPYLQKAGSDKVSEMKAERAAKKGGDLSGTSISDHEEEIDFLKRVRHEASLPVYSVTDDLREMVVQFGCMALFSVVWPLTPVSFLLNNWVELRSDAVKICLEMQRPTPYRADSIGPWIDSLAFLTWLGSVTTSALVYMFSNDGLGPDGSPAALQGWALLATIFASEHLYLLVRSAVRFVIKRLYSSSTARIRAEGYMVRKRALEAQLGGTAGDTSFDIPLEEIKSPTITRTSLENDARKGTLRDSTPASRFWERQKGWQETAQVGQSLIDRMQVADTKGK